MTFDVDCILQHTLTKPEKSISYTIKIQAKPCNFRYSQIISYLIGYSYLFNRFLAIYPVMSYSKRQLAI